MNRPVSQTDSVFREAVKDYQIKATPGRLNVKGFKELVIRDDRVHILLLVP